ncbi:hypothetical protein [Rubricoccus marinus]|uniref:Uncharacterized protein n=1 Tax=Rubricoccus marinus TaxID=716817 RepID=A0A259U2W2_9BACT|nr:hypothetical protein [Rubricoccus marinus]OZC04383.1 hypothetical protein BSZ36_16180 [Rubricoccus marinus]
MTHDPTPTARRTTCLLAALVVWTLALPSAPAAQQNQLGPPEALQYPLEARADAPRGVPILILRDQIERSADLALCQVLMTHAGRPIPAVFDASACEPAFAAKVRDGEGIVHWASGARPLRCGENCIGAPVLRQTTFLTRPNLRRAEVSGKLEFVADPPGPFNRALTYQYNVTFTCAAEDGARTGDFRVAIDIREPVIGDPGPLESVLDFFGSGNLSGFIERRMNEELSPIGSISQSVGRCASVGVFASDNPATAFTSDGALYDPVSSGGSAERARNRPRPDAVGSSRDRATIHFLRIVRKRLPALDGAGQATPGSMEVGQFSVFLNGVHVVIPPLTPNATGTLTLPPEAGVVPLNYCRTVDVTDFDRLQLLFTNGLGGAVWSQFGRAESFGADALNRMTTGRTVVMPARDGPPDPATGRPTRIKPQSVTVREFELVYTMTYAPRGDTVAQPLPASLDRSTGPVRGRARIPRPTLENAPVVVAGTDRPAPGACREI